MYSLLVYNENHIEPIQYTMNITGTASLIEAISCIPKEYKSAGHHKIQFLSCSCTSVGRNGMEKNDEKSKT